MKQCSHLFIFTLLFGFLSGGCASNQASEEKEKNLPEIVHAGMASSGVIELSVDAQWVEKGFQVPYEKLPGDTIIYRSQHRFIQRNGEYIGSLVGIDKNIRKTVNSIHGTPLDTLMALDPESYIITGGSYRKGVHPVEVYLKSKPFDFVRAPARETYAMKHSIFLVLPEALETGKKYKISFPDSLFDVQHLQVDFKPSMLRSESVHVSQVGFRPDDPVKLAFLSCWMGTGGNLVFPAGMKFSVVDASTGKAVYEGELRLSKPLNDPSNRSYTDIYEMDFSSLKEPGTYKVVVDPVGCSFPFRIDAGVWSEAFVKTMKGLFNQRSGIPMEEPYTGFLRKRSHHPDDGIKVYISDPGGKMFPGEAIPTPLPELDYTPQLERFQRWVSELTPQTLPDAWGGYKDAGDWDRRADHALMPLMMFDLEEMFPDFFRDLKFNIPESDDNLPDLINEALWEVDFLKRMQMADGSVFGAIESGDHPRRGENSWQESLPVFAYSRTRGVAYNYAAIAARAALWFRNNNMPEKAAEYEQSLLKAYNWAEQEGKAEAARGNRGGFGGMSRTRGVDDAICLAAAELYRLTGEEKYNQRFLELTRFKDPSAPFYISAMGPNGDAMGQAGWTYLRTDHPGVDTSLQKNIHDAMVRDANVMVEIIQSNDFHWARPPRREIRWGGLSMPESHALCRAHFITGEEKYLKAIILSTQSGAGANPLNLSYVTRVGHRWPLHPLDNDYQNTNQPFFEGVTMGGPEDTAVVRPAGSLETQADNRVYPDFRVWPVTEYYLDVLTYLTMNEFTVHQTMMPTSFVWGYLAGRKE
jgi:endoglucanase